MTFLTNKIVKCPRGRQYKDSCGNDCTCYERTGAVLCNEKRKCPQDLPLKVHATALPTQIKSNALLHRVSINSCPFFKMLNKN